MHLPCRACLDERHSLTDSRFLSLALLRMEHWKLEFLTDISPNPLLRNCWRRCSIEMYKFDKKAACLGISVPSSLRGFPIILFEHLPNERNEDRRTHRSAIRAAAAAPAAVFHTKLKLNAAIKREGGGGR